MVGATGSIGQHVVEEALKRGYQVRALVRNPNKARFDDRVEIFIGDLTRAETLKNITDGVDGIISPKAIMPILNTWIIKASELL